MKLRSKIPLAVLATASFALTSVTPVLASTSDVVVLSAEDIQGIHERSTALGIPADVQETLIENMRQGKLPDSATAEPVSVKQSIEGAFEVTTKTFADGSVSKNSVEIGNKIQPFIGGVVPRSVDSCRIETGRSPWRFTGCRVRTSNAHYTIEFRSDGYQGGFTNPSRIDRIYGSWRTGAGTAGNPVDEIMRRSQSGSDPAMARSTYHVSMGPLGFPQSLTFYARDYSMWDTSP